MLLPINDDLWMLPHNPLGAAIRHRYKPARPAPARRGQEAAAHLFAAETE